jgi:hypothetical protein
VAEELALEHAWSERGTVDGDERRADAVAPVVDSRLAVLSATIDSGVNRSAAS